jgi:tyrosine-protein kinase Fer
MEAPDGTPSEVYNVMMLCWEYDAANRPHFDKVHKMLKDIAANMK